MDEFEIKATGHPVEKDRIWTRGRLSTAQFIADQAISQLGYDRAEVVNTYKGVRSNVLYVAEKLGTHSHQTNGKVHEQG